MPMWPVQYLLRGRQRYDQNRTRVAITVGEKHVTSGIHSLTPWPASVLVVEDDSILALDVQTTLTNLGYGVPAIAASGEDAIARVREYRPDLLLIDIDLRGEMDGIEAVERIHQSMDLPVIYLAAYADTTTVERARKTQPYGYLLKPFEERELHIVIEMALYRHEMQKKLRDSERWLSATLRSIGDAVVATDGDWRIHFMNPAAEKLTGWTAESAKGRELADVLRVTIAVPPRPLAEDDRRHASGGIAQGVLISRDGTRIPIEESSTTIRDDSGKVVGSVLALRRTDRRR